MSEELYTLKQKADELTKEIERLNKKLAEKEAALQALELQISVSWLED